MSDKNTRVIAVASGKGGVGKTNISLNLSLAVAAKGNKTCLFDADIGLANIDILLNINPEFTLEDVITGERDLDEVIIRDLYGIDIVPGSSGVEKLSSLDEVSAGNLKKLMGALDVYDFLVFDTSAGITKPVTAFCMAASEVLLVITPEPTSMTDAYAFVKVLILNHYKGEIKVIVNQCRSASQVKKEFLKFQRAVLKFLKLKVSLAGFVVSDSKVVDAVKQQEPFYIKYPDSNASKCIDFLARNLISKKPEKESPNNIEDFWDNCFDYITGPLLLDTDDTGASIDKGTAGDGAVTSYAPAPSDQFTNLMQDLIKSVNRMADEIKEINEQLKHKKFTEPPEEKSGFIVDNTKQQGFSLDYESYIQKKK